MRKVLKIASYDFKRIMSNPITIVFLVVVLALCFITGLVYKIPASGEYITQIKSETTKDFYTTFTETDSTDSKSQLDGLLQQTQNYINLFSISSDCVDGRDLNTIKENFQEIKEKTERAKGLQFNGSFDITYNEIKDYTENLQSFIEEFEAKKDFDTNLMIEKKNFSKLKDLSMYFNNVVQQNTTVKGVLEEYYKNFDNFDKIAEIISSAETWHINDEELKTFQTKYYETAVTKTTNIANEMKRLNDLVNQAGSTEYFEELKNLATNYKLTCESAKYGVLNEFRIILEKHYNGANKIQGYNDVYLEEARDAISKINYFLQDESLYYTQYQAALNFNSASYKVSAFDYTYFMLSIVGFLTILFAIFLVYKFFGLDRKHGKIDILISQNATFNQVFAGQFLAIFYCTSFCIAIYTLINFIWGALMYSFLPNSIMAVFNTNTVYFISPFVFLLLKMIGIELQVLFYTTISIFIMNLSRKFEINFAISLLVFAIATVCNIFLNNIFVYCLLPFIHADLTSFLGGATMQSGFLRTALYSSGNFFISLAYYLVIVLSLFTFTKQLFRKN